MRFSPFWYNVFPFLTTLELERGKLRRQNIYATSFVSATIRPRSLPSLRAHFPLRFASSSGCVRPGHVLELVENFNKIRCRLSDFLPIPGRRRTFLCPFPVSVFGGCGLLPGSHCVRMRLIMFQICAALVRAGCSTSPQFALRPRFRTAFRGFQYECLQSFYAPSKWQTFVSNCSAVTREKKLQ